MVEPFTLATARRTLELPNRQNLKFVGVEQHFEGLINVWCRQPGDGDVFGLKRRFHDGAAFCLHRAICTPLASCRKVGSTGRRSASEVT